MFNKKFVCDTLLWIVMIHTIFPLFFCRPNPLKVIPTRLSGTPSSTSCPRGLLFHPLYRGLAVPQSPTTVSLTYCEMTEIRRIHWYLISSKNLHPQQILKLNFCSLMKLRTVHTVTQKCKKLAIHIKFKWFHSISWKPHFHQKRSNIDRCLLVV